MFLWWRIPRRFYRAIPSTFTVDIVFCCALDSIRFKPSRNFIRTDSEMIIISDKKQKWRRVSRGISCHGNRCAWPWQRPTTLPPPDWPSQFLEICQSTCTDSLPWQRPATPLIDLVNSLKWANWLLPRHQSAVSRRLEHVSVDELHVRINMQMRCLMKRYEAWNHIDYSFD